jgi:hypothetical protein
MTATSHPPATTFAHDHKAQESVRLLIGTPAYGGMIHCDYVSALLAYQHAGIAFGLMTIGNESLITRARNTILAEFDAHEDFTHLLFLDADVLLPAAGLQRMIAHGKDVIGAPVALKGRAADGNRLFNLGEACGEEGALLLCTRIGTAALMLSRRAVAALIADAKAHGHAYTRGSSARGTSLRAAAHYDVFRVGVIDGEYLSEDYWACRSLRRLGFAIHVDPTVVTQHSGVVQV